MTGGRRTGITTGACAAAAAKAAAMVLCGQAAPAEVEIPLPGGGSLRVPVLRASPLADGKAAAAVRKDAGDDPDVTHGMEVVVTLWQSEGSQTEFLAGEGVGTVTKPGLQVPPGQPAINPAPGDGRRRDWRRDARADVRGNRHPRRGGCGCENL